MKIGVVSDIHCNALGLSAALTAMGAIDRLICLGDSILQYRFSNEVIGMLRQHDAQVILGNHEEIFLGPLCQNARAADWIDRAHLQWLAERPQRMELNWGGKRLLLVHSTPWEPRGAYVHPGDMALRRFGDVDADIVFYGHTHMQVAERVGRVLVLNPGSAGEGRDHRYDRQLCCATLDLVTDEVVFFNYPDPYIASLLGRGD